MYDVCNYVFVHRDLGKAELRRYIFIRRAFGVDGKRNLHASWVHRLKDKVFVHGFCAHVDQIF